MISNTELFFAKALKFQEKRSALVEAYETKLKGLEKFRGSAGYDQEVKALKKKHEADLTALREEYEPGFRTVLDAMVAAIGRRNLTPPTADQVATLQVLKMKRRVTADDIARAAQTVKDSRLALDVLADIAQEHGVPHSGFDDLCPEMSTADALRAVDNLRSGINDFMTHDTKKISRIAADYYARHYGDNGGNETALPKREQFTDREGCFREIGGIDAGAMEMLTPLVNA